MCQLKESLDAKRASVKDLDASYSSVKEKHSASQTAINVKEELLQTLLTGLSSSNATGGGYMGQLAEAKSRLAHAVAEEEQGRVKLTMAEKDLVVLKKRWMEVEKDAGDGKRRLEAQRREVEGLENKVKSSGWSTEKEQERDNALRSAKSEVRRLIEVC